MVVDPCFLSIDDGRRQFVVPDGNMSVTRVVDGLCPSLLCEVCRLIVVNKKASNMDVDPGARPRSTSVRLIVETVSLGNWIWVGRPASSSHFLVVLVRRVEQLTLSGRARGLHVEPASFSFALSSIP
jgi:hypothetical protein